MLAGLRLAIYHPALDWLDAGGRRQVFDGLDEFREHLGGELTVLMLRDIGLGTNLHWIDPQWVGACIDELRARWLHTTQGAGGT